MIYTIDARDNVYLESMAETMGLDNDTVYNVIEDMHLGLLEELKKVKINYCDLKNALTPQKQKREIAFVFDSEITGSDVYGIEILTKFISIFDKQTCNSILMGDLIANPKFSDTIRDAFFHFLTQEKGINYVSHELFFIVYINNLSDLAFNNIRNGLKNYLPYVGYFDLTFSNEFKHYLSTILVRSFIKNKNQIIAPEEITGMYNPTCYPFEDYGFKCNAIDSLYYEIFLSYKIERPANSSGEDIRFSLNAVSTAVFQLSAFKLVIEEPKLEYLLKEKKDNLERAGMLNMSLDELENQINSKINTNYIFNLCFLPKSKTIKFNIMLEMSRNNSAKKTKLTVALEYIAEKRVLRLITMF